MPPEYTPSIEISLDNLVYNLHQLQSRLHSPEAIIAVVKDNAYGCGAPVIAETLENEGISFFAVASMHEARELRSHGIDSPILVLGEATVDEITWASSHDVRIVINDYDALTRIAQYMIPATLHINIDTGMQRLGIAPAETESAIAVIARNRHLTLEGLFTHFACADEPGTDSVTAQLSRFDAVQAVVKKHGIPVKYIHSSNSAAATRFPVPPGHLVRPGIVLLGCKPDPGQEFDIDLRPIVSLKAPIIKIKKVARSTAVSYGWTYAPDEDTSIATVPIGYAHGYPRALSNKGEVLIRGKRFPVAGRVTMDYILVNLGAETDIQTGEEVVAIGSQKDACITPDDLALQTGTIGYEILCGLSNRIDRYYYRQGKIIRREPTPLS